LIKNNSYWCLTREIKDPSKYGVFEKNIEGNAIRIIEKPKAFYWNTTNVWCYKFNDKLFEINDKIKLSERWEYEITDSINLFCKQEKFKLVDMQWEFIDIWYPWDILDANKYFLEKLEKSEIHWTVEKNVIIKWNIVIENWAVLKSGTYIEWNCYIGKNTSIWPNIYIRWNTVIWDNCHIWANNEIKNSNIWENTNIAHLSYIWDSIIWNDVNIGWGFISANLRHDETNIKVPVKWILTDSWKPKLWVIIWDNCKIWINASSMPWRVVETNSLIMPSEIIK
jgi:bifunctional UDP-N-acetylglucosamine pyrophosphorylase/glucosamine-1-phosphate N-acetyltransferase